ncbi:MAG: site-specific integrase [Rikenellaceae bacterium]
MAKIIYSLVYNRKGKLLKDGTAPVSVCAYLNAQRKYFATDIKLKPEQWDKRRQKIKATAPNYIQRNTYLSDFLATLERYELEQIEAGRSVTLDCLAEALNPKEDHSDFLAFFKKESANKKTITENTRRVYNSTYHHLTMFRSRILLDDLTYQFLHEFENYLLGKGINTNTAGKYLKTIKTVVNLAINYGYMDYNNYPFRNYVIRSQPTNRTYLDPKEIERIEALEIPAERVNLQIVKDMYLFAVYSGLRFSDIVRLSPDNIQVIEGKQYIVINMEKTKEPLRLPIFKLFNGKPLELLAKYTRPNRKFYFDDFTNQFVNRELKEIARLAGVDKVVTFHTARHTTATYLLYKGVPMVVVQKILGHQKISTTQCYAKVMDMTIENELDKVFD